MNEEDGSGYDMGSSDYAPEYPGDQGIYIYIYIYVCQADS